MLIHVHSQQSRLCSVLKHQWLLCSWYRFPIEVLACKQHRTAQHGTGPPKGFTRYDPIVHHDKYLNWGPMQTHQCRDSDSLDDRCYC